MSINRRGFIKLGGASLFLAGMLGIDKSPLFEPQYDQEIVITIEDTWEALQFWVHFDNKIPDSLMKIYTKMENLGHITPELQHDLKVAVCKEIATSGAPMFADEMFTSIKKECWEVVKNPFKKTA